MTSNFIAMSPAAPGLLNFTNAFFLPDWSMTIEMPDTGEPNACSIDFLIWFLFDDRFTMNTSLFWLSTILIDFSVISTNFTMSKASDTAFASAFGISFSCFFFAGLALFTSFGLASFAGSFVFSSAFLSFSFAFIITKIFLEAFNGGLRCDYKPSRLRARREQL